MKLTFEIAVASERVVVVAECRIVSARYCCPLPCSNSRRDKAGFVGDSAFVVAVEPDSCKFVMLLRWRMMSKKVWRQLRSLTNLVICYLFALC